MNIMTEELLSILGAKEVEIYLLRKKISELQISLKELKTETQTELKAVF